MVAAKRQRQRGYRDGIVGYDILDQAGARQSQHFALVGVFAHAPQQGGIGGQQRLDPAHGFLDTRHRAEGRAQAGRRARLQRFTRVPGLLWVAFKIWEPL